MKPSQSSSIELVEPSRNYYILFRGLLLIFTGCVINNIALEIIITDNISWSDKGAGGLLTVFQYILVATLTLPDVLEWKKSRFLPLPSLKRTVIPLKEYLKLAALFGLMTLLNNIAFAFHISQPMHMVFRSANLMVTFLFGKLFFGKTYTFHELFAVILLTIGAGCNTVAEAVLGDTARKASSASCTGVGCNNVPTVSDSLNPLQSDEASTKYMLIWSSGVLILTAVLCIQSCLAEIQNRAGAKYGKAPAESSFYMHLLSLPIVIFLLLLRFTSVGTVPVPYLTLSPILDRISLWSKSPCSEEYFNSIILTNIADNEGVLSNGGFGPIFIQFSSKAILMILQVLNLQDIPVMYVFVAIYTFSQYMCIRGVYDLISESDPLGINVTLTVRKAVSMILSVSAFNNTFTVWHWIGTTMVFGGALYFSISPKPKPTDLRKGQKKNV